MLDKAVAHALASMLKCASGDKAVQYVLEASAGIDAA
jgi:hypothetical protein